jgi:drug/metabolite transporter (DMT)-like permease
MDPVALVLVLAAAGVHAGWNRLLHDSADRIVTLAIAALLSALLLLPAIVLQPPTAVVPLVIVSAGIETVYALCLAAAYRQGDLSLAYPIGRGVSPLLVTLGAWIVLGQGLRPATVAGAGALGLGLTCIAWRGAATDRRAAILFAVLTGACIAGYSLVDSQAVHQTPPAGYLGLVLGLQGLLLTVGIRPGPERWRPSLRPAVLIAVGSVAAYLLVLLAFQRAAPGRVSTLRESSVLIGLMLARERSNKTVWFGAGLVVLGAVLVAG